MFNQTVDLQALPNLRGGLQANPRAAAPLGRRIRCHVSKLPVTAP